MLLDVVISALNHAPSKARGNLSPMQSFMGMEETNPLVIAVSHNDADKTSQTLIDVDPQLLSKSTEELRAAIDAFHEIISSTEEGRTTARDVANQKRLAYPEFIPGDYVMITDVTKTRWKLQAVKRGPYLVVDSVSDWVYRVKDIISGKEKELHAERLEFYDDKNLLVTEDLKEQIRYQSNAYEVQKLCDVRKSTSESGWEILVQWKGFERAEATWEDAMLCIECCPALLADFLSSKKIPREFKLVMQRLLQG